MRRHAESKSKEHDWLLPVANVSRIMKKVLPKEAKLSKEAKEAVQECVSEFVSFITGEALERCHEEKRKTINGDDLLWALAIFGFDEYVKTLEVFLRKFREIEGGDKNPAGTASRRKDIGDGKDVGDGGRGGAGGGGVGNGGGLYDDAFMGMDEDIMALLEGFYGDY